MPHKPVAVELTLSQAKWLVEFLEANAEDATLKPSGLDHTETIRSAIEDAIRDAEPSR